MDQINQDGTPIPATRRVVGAHRHPNLYGRIVEKLECGHYYVWALEDPTAKLPKGDERSCYRCVLEKNYSGPGQAP